MKSLIDSRSKYRRFCGEIVELVESPAGELFEYDNQESLVTELNRIASKCAIPMAEYDDELLSCFAREELSWDSRKHSWYIVLEKLSRLHAEINAQSDSENAEDEEVHEADDGDVGMDEGDARWSIVVKTFREDLSYTNDILTKAPEVLSGHPVTSPLFVMFMMIKGWVMGFFGWLKGVIKSILHFFSIDMALIILVGFVNRNKRAARIFKMSATFVVLPFVVFVELIIPLLMYARNPMKIVRKIFEELEIQVPMQQGGNEVGDEVL